MARPRSEHANKLAAYLNANPATLATAATELGLEYKSAVKLLSRLVYAERVLVLRKERMSHCKKPVALYAGKEWWQQQQEQREEAA